MPTVRGDLLFKLGRLDEARADFEKAWDRVIEAQTDNRTINAMVTDRVKGGLVVDLGIRGFVPASQLAFGNVRSIGDAFKIDETLNLRVIEFDSENKKIVLSATEWLKAQDRAIVDEYNAKEMSA